jgi:hypothetical protein
MMWLIWANFQMRPPLQKVISHPQSIEASEAVRQSQVRGLAANAWNVARLQR